jgi:polyhydroxyalkanoate synthesis regulator protein
MSTQTGELFTYDQMVSVLEKQLEESKKAELEKTELEKTELEKYLVTFNELLSTLETSLQRYKDRKDYIKSGEIGDLPYWGEPLNILAENANRNCNLMDKHLEDYENTMRDIIYQDNKKEYKKEYKSMTNKLESLFKKINPYE